jgi:hypothetical protein
METDIVGVLMNLLRMKKGHLKVTTASKERPRRQKIAATRR